MILAILFAVSVYDGYHVRVSNPQILLGYSALIPAGLLALAAVLTARLPRPLATVVPVWLAALFGYGAIALLRDVNDPVTVLVDVVNFTAPLVLLLAVIARPGLVSLRSVRVLLVGLGIAAVVAFVVNPGVRFDAPSTVLLAGLWVWVSRRPSWRSGGAVVVAAYLALASGYRTQLVLWGLLGFLALAAGPRWLRGVLLLGAATLGALLLFGVIAPEEATNSTRIFNLADESSARRVDEIRDALAAMRDWPMWLYPFGSGAGGSFEAHYAYNSLNLDAGTGTVHHVHVGPVATMFRLGLFGLIVMAVLYVAVARSVLAIDRQTSTMLQFFSLATAGLMAEWLFFDVTTYPMFGYALAGWFYYEFVAVSVEPGATTPPQRAECPSPARRTT